MAKGKVKLKGQGKAKNPPSEQFQKTPLSTQCETLDEDEITRCGLPVEDGNIRCKVHQTQYRKMYIKYKEAGKFVDETKSGREMPTKERITGYTDVASTLEEARWMRQYLEAIQIERTGRGLHMRRFFAKGDDGHKIRLKLLEKRMVQAIEILDALQARAFDLYMLSNPAREWVKSFQTTPLIPTSSENEDLLAIKSITKSIEPTPQNEQQRESVPKAGINTVDADLIEIELRAIKAQLLYVLGPFIDQEVMLRSQRKFGLLGYHTRAQYLRRIVLHEPVLSLKATNRVSFKDLILDEEFTPEDLERIGVLLDKQMQIGLLWWKDSLIEAMSIIRNKLKGTAVNIGDPKKGFKILGGWVLFNTPHSGTMSNEMWGNRFVRLCNSYDDMISYLSFGALGLFPPPTFCARVDKGRNGLAARNHISLSGVVIVDMVTGEPQVIPIPGPVPTLRRGRSPGSIIWVEMEKRAYLFGALRNEPDAFTDAFISRLRKKPDLFQVVLYSETDLEKKIECFGSGNEALPAFQMRTFEALPPSINNHPLGRSAVDLLFRTKQGMLGYLTTLTRSNSSGWFFHFKKMPVKYFVILDTVPHRHHSILAREVAWVALCVQGFGEGEYSDSKYARASNRLFEKCAEERFGSQEIVGV
ncbi:hypothetical protein EV368DRAFT_74789 [Lentinula lateritia]|nr:hypothetical protein EV368DRAFT_74789 [Lentinula lateritia]